MRYNTISESRRFSFPIIVTIIFLLLLVQPLFAAKEDNGFSKIFNNLPFIIAILVYLLVRKKKKDATRQKPEKKPPGPEIPRFSSHKKSLYEKDYKPIEPK
ncbi:hypothetical protein DRQ36_08260 [bacterium]|nr:MAG: hypothetical protein DRQ36_08260 [bacterium]